MAFTLNEINRRAAEDPAGFAAECDRDYFWKVDRTAEHILSNIHRSHIILLAGPSGSGKTTTAQNIEHYLDTHGVETHTISLDDYYTDVDPETTPRNAQGEYDFESPYLLDLALLREHFRALDAGEEILIPRYDFHTRRRDPEGGRPLRLKENELALFEGIHALNGEITGHGSGALACKVYVSTRSNVMQDKRVIFKSTWTRILRRVIRDVKFRSTSAASTFYMWENLRLGEKRYIAPYRDSADVRFDSSLGYELNVLRAGAEGIFDDLPEGLPRRDEVLKLQKMLGLFEPMDPALLGERSLLHEFIG